MRTHTGTVEWFSFGRGFGFIKPDNPNSADVFVHISAVERAGLDELREGDRLSYEVVASRDGRPKAINLEVRPAR